MPGAMRRSLSVQKLTLPKALDILTIWKRLIVLWTSHKDYEHDIIECFDSNVVSTYVKLLCAMAGSLNFAVARLSTVLSTPKG